MSRTGLVIVISGPSGAGKGTLCQALLGRNPNLRFSVSVTTRPQRAGEVDGVHYFFWPEERFADGVVKGLFLEWAMVYGRHYGTPSSQVDEALAAGSDVLLDLDIQGARQVKQKLPQATLVFLLPPSLEALGERITRRATETAEERRLRLDAALNFIGAAEEFDYVVINDSLEEASADLEAIIRAERCRASRQLDAVRSFTAPREVKGDRPN